MIGIEKSTVHIDIEAYDPYLAFSCEDNIIHGNICPRTAERSFKHHSFFNIRFSVKEPVQSCLKIFKFNVCQITQCTEIDSQKGQAVRPQITDSPDQCSVSAENKAALCVCRDSSRDDMSFAVFF